MCVCVYTLLTVVCYIHIHIHVVLALCRGQRSTANLCSRQFIGHLSLSLSLSLPDCVGIVEGILDYRSCLHVLAVSISLLLSPLDGFLSK